MDPKVFESIGSQVLQEMYEKMDFRSVKEQLDKSGHSTASSGDGHLELSLPTLEITNLSEPERPSPSASPELKSSGSPRAARTKSIKAERDAFNLIDSYPYPSRAQLIQDLKVQLTGTDTAGLAWNNNNTDLHPEWDQHRVYNREKSHSGGGHSPNVSGSSSSSEGGAQVITPDITPITSPESSSKVLGQFQKHLTAGTILSPGIPGLLPPLISSTPYVRGPISRVYGGHGRSFSENDALPVKHREEQQGEASKQKPFRPWECSAIKVEAEPKAKTEIADRLKTQRTSSLTTAPAFEPMIPTQNIARDLKGHPRMTSNDLGPLHKAMVFQHSKLAEDLSWLQHHRPNDPQVFVVCRDYSAQVDHLERLRYQALAMATACPESMTNIDSHYDQQRLELLRSTTHKIASLKAVSFQYTIPYHVPDIPYFQPLSVVCPQLTQANGYPQPGFKPGDTRRRMSDPKFTGKMECVYVPQSQVSPVDQNSGSTSTDSAYHSLSNNSSSSDTSTSSSSSSENLKLVEHVEKLCPQAPYENEELKPKGVQPSGNKENRLLNRQAVRFMEYWYNLHFDHPYPSDTEAQELARKGGISVAQVKKWMANKRVRSYNTLSFNGSIHPRKLKRLRQQQEMVYTQLSRANVRYNPIAIMPRM